MRVAFAVRRPPQLAETGAGRRIRRTARLLADRDHEVTVLCSRWWDGLADERVVEDVRYVAVAGRGASARRFALGVSAALLRDDPDLVHAAAVPPGGAVAAKVGATAARAPLVVDWYGDQVVPDGTAADLALRWADAVVAPSRLVRTRIRERGADGDAVRVVPDSIDAELVRSVPPDGDADVVYARHLDEHANLESLLLALAELRERDWSCLVVGDGPARERYEQQAADLRIDDRVEFAGDLPLQERLAVYRAAHAFVQTAREEPFAVELLWALSAGCVGVVEYQAGSAAHELIERRDRGIRTTNDRELTDALRQAAGMPEMDASEEFDDYDHAAVLDRLLDLYDEFR